MKKKFLALSLAALMTVGAVSALASCGEDKKDDPTEAKMKIGLITLHDSTSTYDKNFIDAMTAAAAVKGVEVVTRTGIPEGDECYNTACDLADEGCKLVFADSFGHEAFMYQAAQEYTDVEFCHATGVTAKAKNQTNFHNAFASIYEGRYLAGVVAGMKIVEMFNNGQLKDANFDADGNIKMGYVGAFPYEEVKSGYTSYFLGARNTVNEANLTKDGKEVSVSMEVTFTSSWYDLAAEKTGAETLIERGAALISQHADSMGAPSACEAAGVPNVCYNVSTAGQCGETYLVASRINWQPYFEYIIDCVKEGKKIDLDWCGTMQTGSVELLELGKNVAEGTQAKVDEVKAKLLDGSLKVFDTATFTVGGVNPTELLADLDGDFTPETNVVKNGVFEESNVASYRSGPYFGINIDGITLLNGF